MALYDTRKITNKTLDALDEGMLSYDTVVTACLKFMSEDDVAEMARINEFFLHEEFDEAFDEFEDEYV